jgi:iron complex outermembrane receptor protein
VLANNFKKSLIAANIGLVLTAGVSGVAYANEGSKAQEDVEVIEVRGLRGSLKANINNKRFANNVVDSISAEDIGKFPDKNVADSLSRITGVAVSREFGEGEKITIRGAGPKYNRTLLNGQSVGTADWFILDEANRSFNYTMLPSVIISELEVYKSPSASIEEGSLGGTVILKTRQPLKLDANSGAVSVEAQYSEKSGETDPLVSGMYSWKNDDETLGFLISAVKQDRSVERTGFEVLGWIEDDNDKYIVPRNIGVPLFIQDRERETLFATLQYAPNDSLVATLNVLDSKMDANNQNANLINFLYAEREAAIANATKVGSDGAIVAGTNPDGRFAYNYINRISSTETNQIHLDVDYSTDDFTLNFEIGSTKAEGGTVRETSWEYNAQTAYSYDLTGTPKVQLDIDPFDGSKFTAGWIWGGSKPTTDEESWLQIDVDFPVEVGPFTKIKTGLKFKDAERTQGRHAYSWHAPTDVII